MDNQTILLTGATDGIGRGTAMELALRGATVLLHGRDSARLRATREEIAVATGVLPHAYLADFSSLSEVRGMASKIRENHPFLDVLINNAGIGRTAMVEDMTVDMWDEMIAINLRSNIEVLTIVSQHHSEMLRRISVALCRGEIVWVYV